MKTTVSTRRASALLAALIAPYVAAQPAPPAAPVDLRYTGAGVRLGLGYDSDNHLRGDGYWVLREDERSAWIAEGWLADRSAGGAKLSYHWRPDGAADAPVRKAFAAIDQNRWHDRKLTFGGGVETDRYSLTAYGAAGLTGRRNVGSTSSSSTEVVTGADELGQFEQDVTTTTTRTSYERAYDWGVGVRAGHFYERALVRVDLGADYEWGRGSASQSTVSIGLEKFFDASPWSVALVGEAYRKHGGEETKRDDQRVFVMLRYEFGGNAWRPAKQYRDVKIETPPPPAAPPATSARAPAPTAPIPVVPPPGPVARAVPAPVPTPPPVAVAQPRVEKRIVKTTATASADAFFDFDRSVLRPEAKLALDQAIAKIKSANVEGNIRVSGHTCDIGTDAYNQKLSERRAKSVRDYLVAGGLPADRILAEGMGEREPRYPNDRAGRPKNRRVDIEYVTYAERVEETVVAAPPVASPPAAPTAVVRSAPPAPAAPAAAPAAPAAPAMAAAPAAAAAAPAIEWRREEIDSEPVWVRRALHNTARHKQTVDVYRTTDVSTDKTIGPKRYVNRPPQAVADVVSVPQNAAAVLVPVLANDVDPDGDALSIVSTTAAAHGSVAIAGTAVSYQPAAGYTGSDSFSYTVRDAGGLTSTATVSVTVTPGPSNNRAPIANADAYTVASDSAATPLAVLANDSDPDGDALAIVSAGSPAHGSATIQGGAIAYKPAAGYVGIDTFSYTISDGRGLSASASVTVTVTGGPVVGNHAPIARDDYAIAGFNQPVTIAVLANDTDPDGDTIVVESFTQPDNGTITRGPGNTLVYLSKKDYVGYDRFVYTITDGRGGKSTANVQVYADP
ncbi:MAG: Ig-like domain-containing protein [Burkholderiales bacterium]